MQRPKLTQLYPFTRPQSIREEEKKIAVERDQFAEILEKKKGQKILQKKDLLELDWTSCYSSAILSIFQIMSTSVPSSKPLHVDDGSREVNALGGDAPSRAIVGSPRPSRAESMVSTLLCLPSHDDDDDGDETGLSCSIASRSCIYRKLHNSKYSQSAAGSLVERAYRGTLEGCSEGELAVESLVGEWFKSRDFSRDDLLPYLKERPQLALPVLSGLTPLSLLDPCAIEHLGELGMQSCLPECYNGGHEESLETMALALAQLRTLRKRRTSKGAGGGAISMGSLNKYDQRAAAHCDLSKIRALFLDLESSEHLFRLYSDILQLSDLGSGSSSSSGSAHVSLVMQKITSSLSPLYTSNALDLACTVAELYAPCAAGVATEVTWMVKQCVVHAVGSLKNLVSAGGRVAARDARRVRGLLGAKGRREGEGRWDAVRRWLTYEGVDKLNLQAIQGGDGRSEPALAAEGDRNGNFEATSARESKKRKGAGSFLSSSSSSSWEDNIFGVGREEWRDMYKRTLEEFRMREGGGERLVFRYDDGGGSSGVYHVGTFKRMIRKYLYDVEGDGWECWEYYLNALKLENGQAVRSDAVNGLCGEKGRMPESFTQDQIIADPLVCLKVEKGVARRYGLRAIMLDCLDHFCR